MHTNKICIISYIYNIQFHKISISYVYTIFSENTLKYALCAIQSKTIILKVIFLIKMHYNNKLTIFVITL